ncbi:MAG: DNA-methyltransferase [Gemmatimonadaceae bacterium]
MSLGSPFVSRELRNDKHYSQQVIGWQVGTPQPNFRSMATSIHPRSEPSIDDKILAKERAHAAGSALLQTRHEIYLGDAREMPELSAPESLHLVVTSPPYWTLKEYEGSAGARQLGHVEEYKTFLMELDRVWRRSFDLLVPGGRLCIVVGDVCIARKKAKRHFVVPLHADISVRCRRIGFDYLTPILWYKIANARTEVEGNGAPFLGKPYEPNAIIKNDIEYILLFRKPGGYRSPSEEQRALSVIDKAKHAQWFRAIWSDIPGSSREKGHPAPYPEELAYRLINMFSFVGDTVLDPFLGTASTTAAAIRANRSSIGYEVEERYLQIAAARLEQGTFGASVSYHLGKKQPERPQSIASETSAP